MAEVKKRWYVVRAIGGKERKVLEYMELEIKRAELDHLVGQILIPTEKVYQIRNGKKISKERSFYFILFNLIVVKGRIDLCQ